MLQTQMLLPKMQVVGNYTQNGSDAAFVGGAEAVALQFFVDNLNAADEVTFTVQHSTSKSDDQFVDSSVTPVTFDGASGASQTAITIIDYNDIAGFIRLKLTVDVTGGNFMDVRCQMNFKGGR